MSAAGTLARYVTGQSVTILSVLSFFLIRDISAAITSLNYMKLLISTYIDISLFLQVVSY